MRKEMLKKSIGTIVMTIALVGTSIPGVTVSPVKVNADVATTVSASSNEVGKLESIFTTIDLMLPLVNWKWQWKKENLLQSS